MATSYGALCTDFYINHKLSLKMDLHSERETILHFFEAVRKYMPSMNRFRRYKGELALESNRRNPQYCWLSLQRNSLRTSDVNPYAMADGYQFHKRLLGLAPFHLTISPLDVDFQELMFGFDLECKADHDEVVFDALFAETPFGDLLKIPGGKMLDVQPVFGMSFGSANSTQIYFEVKTRTKNRRGSAARYKHEPMSLFLTLRRYGPIDKIDDLVTIFDELAEKIEEFATDQFVPNLLTPIARQITSSSA